MDDSALLRLYAENRSDEAFAAVVTRHVNLVYSVALRQAGHPQNAEEITQAVFIILAKKAAGLRHEKALPSWLFQTTRLTAINFVRSEIRRQNREQEAHMQTILNESGGEVWPKIAPLLDDAVAALREKERRAIVLRFYEGRNLREVGLALGASEEAAKKRVGRALEKLRHFFAKRGVDSTTAAIAESISANSVFVAPVALAKTISAVVLAKGATASISTLTLVKGVLKIMAWTKAKTAIVTGVVVLFTAGTATVVVEKVSHPALSAADLSWADDPKYWETDSSVLGKVPAGVFIFRPTRFANGGGGVWAGERMSVKNFSVADLVDDAYGFSYPRTVFPPDMPREHFDVMSTMPSNSRTLLKNELQKRFQLTAHTETRATDVLLLKVQTPDPPGLKPHGSNDGNTSWIGGNGKITIRNEELGGFFGNIESRVGVPVLDETGLKGRYDLQLQWQRGPGESDKDVFLRAVREQLGLELVPATRPIKMLVVEKAK